MLKTATLALLCLISLFASGQGALQGIVTDEEGQPVAMAFVSLRETRLTTETKADGRYELQGIPVGHYTVMAFSYGKAIALRDINIRKDATLTIDFVLKETIETLEEVIVEATQERSLGLKRLNAIENFGVYEGKKTEVVVVGDLTANTATNNARQLYSKVTGLNIWESDGAGIQLGIGGRGLSPNRTSNFNVRQNGYDISADALGYPESYYTPPAEALDQIEIVRGAASLQYGTQFGGLVNFKMRKGPVDKKVEFTTRQTIGSWNFYGTFNSIGGTVAKGKLNYFAYYNLKRGDGYRDNSEFDYHNAYASMRYKITENLEVNADYTRMTYLAHQPGGLSAVWFEENPRQSKRERNWFNVDWNLFALNVTYKFSPSTQINFRNYGLIARRQSLGNLENIIVSDLGGNRTLIDGKFNNFANETRLLHRYKIAGKQNAIVAGFRIYHGTTDSRQGDGDDGSKANFKFLHPNDLENSDYRFPNENYAAFVENIVDITPKFSITPGLRYENIRTYGNGYYRSVVRDNAGNIISENRVAESRSNERGFLLAGLGLSYKHSDAAELYGNISQNYRAINFTDLRVVNPSLRVDSLIHDEKGFTADLGIRGTGSTFRYEVTLFYLSYNGRIGSELREDPVLFKDYRYRTNISDARNIGVEAFGELIVNKLFNADAVSLWSVFVNAAVIDARYVRSKEASIRNNKVEMVPPVIIRTGTTFKRDAFSTTLQLAYIAKHFSDATNANWTPTAIEGEIPSYLVMDFSARYAWRMFSVEASCNNLLDADYYTRRADSYPGPGIIPSDGRAFYVTLQARVGK